MCTIKTTAAQCLCMVRQQEWFLHKTSCLFVDLSVCVSVCVIISLASEESWKCFALQLFRCFSNSMTLVRPYPALSCANHWLTFCLTLPYPTPLNPAKPFVLALPCYTLPYSAPSPVLPWRTPCLPDLSARPSALPCPTTRPTPANP